MNWFNYYGLAIIVVIMLPSIVYAAKNKEAFENREIGKRLLVFEQIARFGTLIFLVFNVPFTYFNFWFNNALTLYLIVNGALLTVYCLCFIIMWRKNNLLRAVLLSALPSAIFLFSGIMALNIPLMIFALIFAVTHISVSILNAAKIS